MNNKQVFSNGQVLEAKHLNNIENNVSQFGELKSQKEEYSNKITTLKVAIATLESEIMNLEQEILKQLGLLISIK